MNRAEFMARLKDLLSDITEAEREEALNYYEDYFDDAGEENEASVIESLGSPEKVAATIKAGLNDDDGINGEFSENGYSDPSYINKDEVAERTAVEKSGTGKKKGMSSSVLILIVILCLFALPILGPVGIGLLSAVFGILCAIAAVLFAVMVAGIAIVVTGIALIAGAIASIFEAPVVALLLAGAGLILGGVGVLLTILGIWILTKLLPPLVRGFVNLCRKPFERRRG